MTLISNTVTSRDGTTIGYWQTGSGEGLVLVHGSGRGLIHFEKLAQALAGSFTVYLYDRRGRGVSGPVKEGNGIREECEDLSALLQATGAGFVFGHSFGGLVALETALLHPVKKMAVYDPGVSVGRSFPTSWLGHFEIAALQGRIAKALIVAFKGLHLHPPLSRLPAWMLVPVAKLLMLKEKTPRGYRAADLVPTMPHDMKVIARLDSMLDRYRNISIPVLLMGGSKSPAFLKEVTQPLAGVLQQPEIKVYPSFVHNSPEDQTAVVAGTLKDFFTRP